MRWIALVLLPSIALAIPNTIQQTGFLTDAQGTPREGLTSLGFGLYGQAEGGALLWSEEHDLNVNEGYYSVELGVQSPFGDVFDSGSRFLEVGIDGIGMLPRIRLSSVPYALISKNVTGDITPRSIHVGGQQIIDIDGNWVGPGLPGENGGVGYDTPQEVLTALKVVDGAGSGLDADTLDGISSAAFLQNGDQIMVLVLEADGTGSGLDADRLDGHDSSTFIRTAAQLIELLLTIDGDGSNLDADRLDGHDSSVFIRNAAQLMNLLLASDGSGSSLDADRLDGHDSSVFIRNDDPASPSVILDLILTVDGENSGIDADRLDNLHASKFMRVDADTGTSGDLSVGGTILVEQIQFSDGTLQNTAVNNGAVFDQDLNTFDSTRFVGVSILPKSLLPTRQSEFHEDYVSASGHTISATGLGNGYDLFAVTEAAGVARFSPATGATITYEFAGNKRTITQYTLGGYCCSRFPKDWTFQGWDGSSWIILDTQSEQIAWSNAEIKEYNLPPESQNPYQKFRINVTSNNGDANWIDILNWELRGYEDASVVIAGGNIDISGSFSAGGAANLGRINFHDGTTQIADGNIDISGNLSTGGDVNLGRINFHDGTTQVTAWTGFNQDLNIEDSPQFSEISIHPPILLPTRQSEFHEDYVSASGHTISSTGLGNGYDLFAVTEAAGVARFSPVAGATIIYEFAGSKRVITQYTLGGYCCSRFPKNWTFQGWDGNSWVVLDTKNEQGGWSNAEIREYDIPVELQSPYQKYKINVTQNTGDANWIDIINWELRGYEYAVVGISGGNLSISGTVDGVDISQNIDQDVRTISSPSFSGLTINGNLGIGTADPGSKLSIMDLPSGGTDAVTGGNLLGALCITDEGNVYIDTDGVCSNSR